MKLSEIITPALVDDLVRRYVPEVRRAGEETVRRIVESGALAAAARLGITFDPEDE